MDGADTFFGEKPGKAKPAKLEGADSFFGGSSEPTLSSLITGEQPTPKRGIIAEAVMGTSPIEEAATKFRDVTIPETWARTEEALLNKVGLGNIKSPIRIPIPFSGGGAIEKGDPLSAIYGAGGGTAANLLAQIVPTTRREAALYAAVPVVGKYVAAPVAGAIGKAVVKAAPKYAEATVPLTRGAVKVFNPKTVAGAVKEQPGIAAWLPETTKERLGIAAESIPKVPPELEASKAVRREMIASEVQNQSTGGGLPIKQIDSIGSGKTPPKSVVLPIAQTRETMYEARPQWKLPPRYGDMPEQIAKPLEDLKIAYEANNKPIIHITPAREQLIKPANAYERAGLSPVFNALQWGESQAYAGEARAMDMLNNIAKSNGIAKNSPTDMLWARIKEGKASANDPYTKNLLEHGANWDAASKAARESQALTDFLHKDLGIEGYNPNYFTHKFDGIPEHEKPMEVLEAYLKSDEGQYKMGMPWFMKPREVGAEGYIPSFLSGMQSYIGYGYKNKYMHSTAEKVSSLLTEMRLDEGAKTYLKASLKDYVGAQPEGAKVLGSAVGAGVNGALKTMESLGLGKTKAAEYMRDFMRKPDATKFNAAVGTSRRLQALRVLSFNLRTPMNILMDDIPAFADLGPKWTMESLKLSTKADIGKDATLRAIWEKSGLPALSRSRYTMGATGPINLNNFEKVAMSLVNAADIQTKKLAFWGEYARYLSTHPGDSQGAAYAGFRFADKIQPLFIKTSTPPIYKTPIAKMAIQFTQPMFQQAGLQIKFLKEFRKNPLPPLRLALSVLALYGLDQTVGTNLSKQFIPEYDPFNRNLPLLGHVRPPLKPILTPTGKMISGAMNIGSGDIGGRQILQGLNEFFGAPGAATDILSQTIGWPEAPETSAIRRILRAGGIRPRPEPFPLEEVLP